MEKTLFKDKKGNMHFGVNAPEGFAKATKEDVKKSLSNLKGRKLWRCNVCSDLHLNSKPPEECPTCHTIDAYVEINLKEFKSIIGI